MPLNQSFADFDDALKIKNGLAPTGVFRQLLGTTQQFPNINIRCQETKDKPGKAAERHEKRKRNGLNE
jgi:hypothetical protein